MGDWDKNPVTPLLQYTLKDFESICNEFKKTELKTQKDIDEIKAWTKAQPHLNFEPNERLIFVLLMLNKFSLEKVRSSMDMYCTVRSIAPQYYRCLPSDKRIREIQKTLTIVPLPKKSKEGGRITVGSFDPKNTNLVDVEALCCFMLILIEVRVLGDCCRHEEIILDYKHAKFSVLKNINPFEVKRFFDVLKKVFKFRILSIHVINLPHYADSFLSIITSFLAEKVGSRIKIHKDPRTLLDYYSVQILPVDFGGEEMSLVQLKDEWRRHMEAHDEHIARLNVLKVDESLRPGKLINDEYLGYHGSFRQLEFD